MAPSKQVVDRRKDALAVHASVETHHALVASGLKTAFEPLLRGGEKLPDLDFALILLGRLIHGAAERVDEADTAHQTELADDDGPRKARDQVTSALIAEVVALREGLDGVHGSDAMQTWGLKGETPREPALLAAFVEDLAAMLEARALPKQRFAATLDRVKIASDLRAKLDPLKEHLSRVALEAREAQGTLVARNEAMDAFDRTFGRTSTALTALYRLAGQDELASRIRPSRRRPGRLAEPSEPSDEPTEPVAEPSSADQTPTEPAAKT